MQFIENQSLTNLNTFGLPATADLFCEIKSERDLKNVLVLNNQPKFILGGGSNLLLTKNMGGLVLKNSILGREILQNVADDRVYVKVGSGENWHEFVRWTLDQNLFGLENLSLIPGTVGAAPIQNIGAYGAELKDCFVKLTAIHIKTGHKYIMRKKQCKFGYRDSIFKNEKKGKYFITAVWFSLSPKPELNLKYGAIAETLAEKNIQNPTPRDVSDAVISIRSSKLPDPAKIGNSGSFFKNPEVSLDLFMKIQILFPQIPNFPAPEGRIKIPAGWLIEQCGWKGKRLGNAGCYEKQALVLVNLGNATGAEIWQLAQAIIDSVFEKFAIQLETEVNVL
jgi:UDP-N-acetylmuramate dehydrogenase